MMPSPTSGYARVRTGQRGVPEEILLIYTCRRVFFCYYDVNRKCQCMEKLWKIYTKLR